jgi:ABC-type antimicrobial peptide transport system permease subunit
VALSGLGFCIGATCAIGLSALLSSLLGGVAFGAATFTTNVVTLRVSASDVIGALILAFTIGIFSGLGPAWRAARLRPIDALRKA